MAKGTGGGAGGAGRTAAGATLAERGEKLVAGETYTLTRSFKTYLEIPARGGYTTRSKTLPAGTRIHFAGMHGPYSNTPAFKVGGPDGQIVKLDDFQALRLLT